VEGDEELCRAHGPALPAARHTKETVEHLTYIILGVFVYNTTFPPGKPVDSNQELEIG
jgi:hypothetical protein